MLNTGSTPDCNNGKYSNYEATLAVQSRPTFPLASVSQCVCVSAGHLWEVATRGARWRAKVKGVRRPPVPPQRRRIDRGVKKVPVRLAAHRENWLLAVFHLRRRGDPEGRSSINAAVFISCFTQSSRCWCVWWWWGGALPLNINFNVLLFARLLLFFLYFFRPSQRCKPTNVCHHTPRLSAGPPT